MTATTPKYGIPYAQPTDHLLDWPATDQAAQTRWDNIWSARTRVSSGIFTAGAGWSVTTGEMDFLGPFVFMNLGVTRTGAAITVPADGNIANETVATFDSSKYVFQTYGPMVSYGTTGRIAVFAISAANVLLGAVSSGANIATNDQFSMRGVGLLQPGHQIVP